MARFRAGHRRLLVRFYNSKEAVWCWGNGFCFALIAYVSSLVFHKHLPFIQVLGVACFAALILRLLDGGPGRLSTFAQASFRGLLWATMTFGHFESIVASLLCGIVVALIWRFYDYDPGHDPMKELLASSVSDK
jgi:hypothetical protein